MDTSDSLNLNNDTISSQVADYLVDWIIDNGLQPGDKIPPELELTKILNTSRSSVREAIALLKSRNIVEVRRGSGTFLRENPGVVSDPFGLFFYPDVDSLANDWGIVRLIIEPSIAELAAINATQEDITALMESWEVLSLARDDRQKHYEADTEFHRLLAEATHNLIIMKLFPIIQESIHRFLTESDFIHTEETRHLHLEILKGVVTHDAVKAKYATEMLICENQNLLGS